MTNNITKTEYNGLLKDIKNRIHSAQYIALKAVNKELILLYWDIGEMIVDRQKGNTWGKAVVKNLAKDIQQELPGVKGFSSSNLWRMKLFYDAYAQNQKLAPMVREIGWTHNLIIMEKCKDDFQREFYIRSTRKYGWTKDVLIHQVENQSYEKVRMQDENPSIGMILCKTKDKTIVEYALRESNKPIGVAEYKMVKTLPDGMKDLLPTTEQIEHLLAEI